MNVKIPGLRYFYRETGLIIRIIRTAIFIDKVNKLNLLLISNMY